MKSFKNTLLEKSHLLITAIVLVAAFAGTVARHDQIAMDESYTWFGYAPVSIQPVEQIELATQHQAPVAETPRADVATNVKPAV